MQLYNSTADLLDLVSHALVKVEPLCRLPVMIPQTSFSSMCDGEGTGCSSSLGEPTPCVHQVAVDFLTASPVDSLGSAV